MLKEQHPGCLQQLLTYPFYACPTGWWCWKAGRLIIQQHTAISTFWQAMRTVTKQPWIDLNCEPAICCLRKPLLMDLLFKTYYVAPFFLLFSLCLHTLRLMSERTLFLGSRAKRRTCLAAGKQLFSPLPLCGWLCCWLNKSCEIISPFYLLGLQKHGCWKISKRSQNDLGQDFFMLRFMAWAADFIIFWQCLFFGYWELKSTAK